MVLKRLLILILVVLITTNAQGGYKDWPGYGNTATRHSITVDGPDIIDENNLQWDANTSPQGLAEFEFEGATGPVVYNGTVYAYAKYLEPNELSYGGYDQTASQVIAYLADSGQLLWTTVIDMAVYGSWSSPVIDAKNDNVIIASGDKVFSLDAETGAIKWSTQLEKIVINASVCVASGISHARAFITDYDGFGTTGKLYSINLDPCKPNNPYQPGQIVWSDTLGSTSGNTPAYKNGKVYVAGNMDAESFYGAVYAYDAQAGSCKIMADNRLEF
jgi:outer membrane protein assembly factor BamB